LLGGRRARCRAAHPLQVDAERQLRRGADACIEPDESGFHILRVARTKEVVEQSGEAVRVDSVQVVAMSRRDEDITHWRDFFHSPVC
jgi:hypothetical protein